MRKEKVFKYIIARTNKGGLVIANSINQSRHRLVNIGINRVSYLDISYIDTILFRFHFKMSAEERFHFYRALALQMKGGGSIKDCMSSLATISHDYAKLNACYITLEAVNAGKSLSRALILAGFPPGEVNTIASGEKSGSVSEAMHALQEEIHLVLQVEKEVKSSLSGPIFALGLLWFVGFLAFGVLVPYLYDNVIAPTKAANVMGSGLLSFFYFCVWVRDSMPYSAIFYYGFPFFVWGGMRLIGTSALDVIGTIGIIGRFRVTLDILRALRILVRNLDFRSSITVAAAQAVNSMNTKSMKNGMTSFVAHLRRGESIEDAAILSTLPVELSMEIASAGKTKYFTERLRNYATIMEAEIKPMGDKVKFIVSLFVITTVAVMIGGLFIAIYLPVVKATLSLAS